MSTLNFNVAGDPKDDKPQLITDNPPGGTFLEGTFSGVPGSPPNRYSAEVPPDISGGATLIFDHGRQARRVIVPPGPGPWEAGLPPCQPPEDPPLEMIYRDVATPPGPGGPGAGGPPPEGRKGLVRLVDKAFVDDGGPFYPLVTSLFWALGGWMKGGAERERVKQNLAFVAQQGFNGVRTFYYVEWEQMPYGGRIHGTPQALAEYLDCCYNEFGLRVKVTVQAGAADPVALGHEVVSAVQPRKHTVLLLEGTNEGWVEREAGVELGRVLMGAGVPAAVGCGNQGIDEIKDRGNEAGTNVDVVHLERTPPVERQDRQCWDLHLFSRAADNGEFVGPSSSVAQCDDPRHLAIQRAGGIICGGEMYCLHTGSGVYGVTYQSSAGMRYANLWEIPNIQEIMRALRTCDAAIGHTGVGNWWHTNKPIPMEFTQNIEKQYFAITGQDFVAILTGVSGPLGQPKFNQPVASWQLFVPWTAEPTNPDAGLPGYVLRGEARMNRRDIAQLEASGRTYFIYEGQAIVFRSEHPLEERTITLTDDYRDAQGRYILPELVAWDGVETCPGVSIR